MERETKKIKLNSGNEIELNTFITGLESRNIQNIYLEGMDLGMSNGEPNINKFDASVTNKAQDKAIEYIVVSFDGKTENILKSILNLPKNEFDEVVEKINEVQSMNDEKKTK